MANYFDKYDPVDTGGYVDPEEERRRQQPNYFDRYDPPAQQPPAPTRPNFFDQYLDQPAEAAQPQQQQPAPNFFEQFMDRPAAPAVPLQQQQPNFFDKYDPQPSAATPEPQAEGMLATGARSAAHAVAPGLAFIPGMVAGAAAGSAVLPGVGTVVGGLLGGLGSSAAGHTLQEAALKVMGFDDSHQQAVNAAVNPWSATAGELVGGAASFGAGPAKLATRAFGAVAGAGLEAGAEYVRGEDLDPARIATGAGAGAILTRPRALTAALGAKTAQTIGRPELWHGAGTSDAGTAQEQPPPRARPDDTAQPYAGELRPQVFEEQPGNAARYSKKTPPQEPVGPQVTPIEPDPTIAAAIRGEPIQPRVFEGEAVPQAPPGLPPRVWESKVVAGEQPIQPRVTEEPGHWGTKLEREFPRAQATEPAPAAVRTPRDAIAQRQPDETVGGALRRFVQDERGGGPNEPPGPRVIEGDEAPRAPGQVDALLRGRGFTPEQIQALSPAERSAILQKRQGEVGAGPPGQRAGTPPEGPPLGPPRAPGGPPEPPRPPERLAAAGRDGDQQAYNAAQRADDELHRLTTTPAAHAIDYLNRAESAAKLHPEIRTTGGEKIYRAIENGTYDRLPTALKTGYENATKDLIAEANAIRSQLIERGAVPKEVADPDYVHRIVKSVPTRIADPINEGRLPGMNDPSSIKALAFRGAQSSDGKRLVLSPGDEKTTIWNNRKPTFVENPTGEALKSGDKFSYRGKEYAVDRGRVDEIERHAAHDDGSPVAYHKNAFLSAFDYHRQMKMMKAYEDWKDNFTSENSPFKSHMTRDYNEAARRGWQQSDIPDLNGLYFHPDLAQVLHNNYNPGLNIKGLDWLRAVNQFAVRSIFWNPVPHSMNALMHYIVGRGWDSIPLPHNKFGQNWLKSTFEGFKAAYTQDSLLQDLNKSGASLIMSKIDSQRIGENLGKILHADLKNNPANWERFARQWGLGRGIDAVNLIYDKSQNALWTFSDALMASRIRELELNNPKMSRAEAIDQARVHMPDYRLPIKFMGSSTLVRAMSDKHLSIFGRYHMGVFQSLGRMTSDLLGPHATMEQRRDALGNVFAMGVLGLVVKPALDGAVQMLTGNPDAETRARGPLGPLTSAVKVAQGKQDAGMALSNIFTFSPGVKQIAQTLSNRDFAGRRIVEPGSPAYKKLGQYAEYTAGNLVSPYGTFGPTVQPGSTKGGWLHELATQLTDTRVPTERQRAGQRYGQWINEREAAKRAGHPRGLIEYGVERAAQ